MLGDGKLGLLVAQVLATAGARGASALAALAARRIAVAPLVDAVYPLRDAVAAFERAATPGTLKVLVDAA